MLVAIQYVLYKEDVTGIAFLETIKDFLLLVNQLINLPKSVTVCFMSPNNYVNPLKYFRKNRSSYLEKSFTENTL